MVGADALSMRRMFRTRTAQVIGPVPNPGSRARDASRVAIPGHAGRSSPQNRRWDA